MPRTDQVNDFTLDVALPTISYKDHGVHDVLKTAHGQEKCTNIHHSNCNSSFNFLFHEDLPNVNLKC